jgi:hypothetical protein
MKYFVFYVKGCEPKVKSFSTLGKARTFAEKYDKRSNEDNWVEHIIKGEFVEFYVNGLHIFRELIKNVKKAND